MTQSAKNGLVRARDVIFGQEWKLTGEQFIDLLERVPLYDREGNPFQPDTTFIKRPLGPLPPIITSVLGEHQAEDLQQWIRDQDDEEILLLQARDYAYLLRADIERFLDPTGIKTPVSHSAENQKAIDRAAAREQAKRILAEDTAVNLTDLARSLMSLEPGKSYRFGTVLEWVRDLHPDYQKGQPGRKKKNTGPLEKYRSNHD